MTLPRYCHYEDENVKHLEKDFDLGSKFTSSHHVKKQECDPGNNHQILQAVPLFPGSPECHQRQGTPQGYLKVASGLEKRQHLTPWEWRWKGMRTVELRISHSRRSDEDPD